MTTPSITDALSAMPNFDRGIDGLLPAIAQDFETGEVLMLAWMNWEAYNETTNTMRGTYYSRSRKELWRKGETSGHRQIVKSVFIDCDADCILLKVEQIGAACHTGHRSCFYRRVDDGRFVIEQSQVAGPRTVYES